MEIEIAEIKEESEGHLEKAFEKATNTLEKAGDTLGETANGLVQSLKKILNIG